MTCKVRAEWAETLIELGQRILIDAQSDTPYTAQDMQTLEEEVQEIMTELWEEL